MRGSSSVRTVAIIPARYGSRRLPAKPLADIAGKPMIQHVYERTAQASLVHKVIVATDDERIASAVRAFGGEAVMTPASMESGSDRIAHVARSVSDADIIVNVQGDEPLIAPQMIDEGIRPLIEDDQILVGTLVRKIDTDAELQNPSIPKVVLDSNGYCLYFSRSIVPFVRDRAKGEWLAHHSYFKHIGLYAFRREFLLRFAGFQQTPLEKAERLEQLRILEHGYSIKAAITTYDTLSVDTEEDLERVRMIMKHQ